MDCCNVIMTLSPRGLYFAFRTDFPVFIVARNMSTFIELSSLLITWIRLQNITFVSFLNNSYTNMYYLYPSHRKGNIYFNNFRCACGSIHCWKCSLIGEREACSFFIMVVVMVISKWTAGQVKLCLRTMYASWNYQHKNWTYVFLWCPSTHVNILQHVFGLALYELRRKLK